MSFKNMDFEIIDAKVKIEKIDERINYDKTRIDKEAIKIDF